MNIWKSIASVLNETGTDSRLGWGFRLGDHADFQILAELGPQTNTKKLGNENNNKNNKKRNVANNLGNTLYAQSQLLNQEKEEQLNTEILHTDGSKWLQSWSDSFKKYHNEHTEPPLFAIGEIDASKVIPEKLGEIYEQSKNIKNISPDIVPTTTEIEESTTENKGATVLAKLPTG